MVLLIWASPNGFAQSEARVIVESFWGSAVTRAIASDFSARTGIRVSSELDVLNLRRFIDGKCAVVALSMPPSMDREQWIYGFRANEISLTSYVVGQAKVIVIANVGNQMKACDCEWLRRVLGEGGQDPTWGGSRTRVRVYGESKKDSISRQVLRRTVMLRDAANKWAGFQAYGDNWEECLGEEAVIKKVKADRDGIGFVLFRDAAPTGVKVLSVAKSPSEKPIAIAGYPSIQSDYPLAEPLVLYLHPTRPEAARQFCEYAIGPDGSAISARFGLVTPYMQRQAEAEARLADMRAGRGVRVSGVGDGDGRGPFQNLAVEYVRAKATIQPAYGPRDYDAVAVAAFVSGGPGNAELLLLSDKPSARAMELHGKQWNALGRDANGGSTPLTAGQPNGAGPAEYLLAGRAAAVIVNPANKIDALTIGQLQAIFGGEVEDWGTLGYSKSQITGSQIKGSQSKGSQIKPYGLRGDDLATGIFEKECLERARWKRVAIKKDSAEVLAAVSMDPQAIGFVDLAGISATGQSIKILGIRLGSGSASPPPALGATSPRGRGVAEGAGAAFPPPGRGGGVYYPTPENIKNAMYPLSQRLWLYVHPQASDTARDFAKFIATCGASEASPYADTVKAVMDTYRKNGLVPLADAALVRMTKDAMAADAARAKAEEGRRK